MGDLAGTGSLVLFLLGLPQLYVSLVGLAAPATCMWRSQSVISPLPNTLPATLRQGCRASWLQRGLVHNTQLCCCKLCPHFVDLSRITRSLTSFVPGFCCRTATEAIKAVLLLSVHSMEQTSTLNALGQGTSSRRGPPCAGCAWWG